MWNRKTRIYKTKLSYEKAINFIKNMIYNPEYIIETDDEYFMIRTEYYEESASKWQPYKKFQNA